MLSKMLAWKVISIKEILKRCNYVGLSASQSSPTVGDSLYRMGLTQVFEQYLIIRIEEQRP